MLAALLAATIVVWLGAVLYSLGIPRSIIRKRNPWIVLLACAAAIGLTAAAYRENQRAHRQAKFLEHYYAAIDERNRGNVEEAEKQLHQAEAVIPGRPEVQQELKALKQPEKPAERRVQTRATQVDPSARAVPPPPAEKVPPEDEKRIGKQPKPLAHLASPFEITHYALEAKLDPPKHTLDAAATIRVKSRGGSLPKLDFSLHAECKPSAITVDSRPAKFTHINDLLSVTPEKPLDGNREGVVKVTYQRTGGAVMAGAAGLISPSGCYFISEARWYPATGELDFRSPVSVKVTVPKGYTAVSVGALRGVVKNGETSTFHWETDRYASMVSLAAGKYTQVATTVAVPGTAGAGKAATPVTCYTFAEHQDKGPLFMKEAAAIVRYYEKQFGPYPYEKLAVVEIPLFPGGYGTTSFVMLLDKSFEVKKPDPFTREFLAHEIGHQWWGNSVFPQGLGAAWLTEAFANYSAWMYAEALSGNPRVLQKRVAKATEEYFNAARVQGDQPIGEADPYQPVGAKQEIIYEKGAVILHMLRRQMGDAAFRRLMRRFADTYRFGKASIADFRKLASEEAGQPLDWFFDQWLGRKGGMELTYSFDTRPLNKQENEAVLTVSQPNAAYRAKMKVVLQVENNVETREIELTGAQNEFRFPVKGKLQSVLLDPENVYLMKPPRWIVPETTAATSP